MEDMTVQAVTESTEDVAVSAACESVDASAVPSQDKASVSGYDKGEASTEASPEATPTEKEGGATATFMPIYKGKVYPMEASATDEITTLLQLGMKQREMQPLMDDLQLLAKQCGAKSVKELIERSRKAYDDAALQEAIDAYGEEQGRAFFESERERARQTLSSPPDEKAAIHERLAEEFIEVREAFDGYARIADLPTEVVETALTQDIHLMDALLRFEHAQTRLTKAEQAAAKNSAACSTGPLKQAGGGGSSSTMDAFLRGLHRRL